MPKTESQLRDSLAAAISRRDMLRAEYADLAARVPEIRAAFGNPFFYTHPEHPDKGEANYTGGSSHEVVHDLIGPTRRELLKLDDEIKRLNAELDAMKG